MNRSVQKIGISVQSVILAILLVSSLVFFIWSQNAHFGEQNSGSAEVARAWLKNFSPTYTFDGFDLDLQSTNESDLCADCHAYNFKFKSKSAGYGNREGQIESPAVTNHVMVVVVDKEGNILSAVTDNAYNELTEEPIKLKK